MLQSGYLEESLTFYINVKSLLKKFPSETWSQLRQPDGTTSAPRLDWKDYFRPLEALSGSLSYPKIILYLGIN